MPRVSATVKPGARPAVASRRKKAAPQDRLTARKLYLRRLRRAFMPGVWLLGIVVVLGLGVSAVRGVHLGGLRVGNFGLASLAADFGYRITNVEIVGANATDPAALSHAIGIKPGDPSLGISLGQVQARVAALGPVQAVTVQRLLPGTLRVTISERAAFAVWQQSETPPSFVLIDKDGNVITDQNAAAAKRRQPNLLLLSGTDAPAHAAALMDALAAVPAVQARVVAAQRVDGLRWNLVLRDQAVVKLPDDQAPAALAELADLQKSMALLDRPVEVIDVRQPGRLVVRPYPSVAATAPNPAPGVKHE
jgi:cell division protein FtsQ